MKLPSNCINMVCQSTPQYCKSMVYWGEWGTGGFSHLLSIAAMLTKDKRHRSHGFHTRNIIIFNTCVWNVNLTDIKPNIMKLAASKQWVIKGNNCINVDLTQAYVMSTWWPWTSACPGYYILFLQAVSRILGTKVIPLDRFSVVLVRGIIDQGYSHYM